MRGRSDSNQNRGTQDGLSTPPLICRRASGPRCVRVGYFAPHLTGNQSVRHPGVLIRVLVIVGVSGSSHNSMRLVH